MEILLRGSALALLLSAAPALAAQPGLTEIAHEFYAAEDRASPVNATAIGIHSYDAMLDDVSVAAHEAQVKRLKDTAAVLKSLDAASLSALDRDDRDVLDGEIADELLHEETIQEWRHNPDDYVQLAVGSVYTLIARDFAPAKDRLAAVIAREQQIPAMLKTARSLLRDVPPDYLGIAIEDAAGAVEFFKTAPGLAFQDLGDKAAMASFQASNQQAISAMQSYLDALVAMKPLAKGKFAWGADTLHRHLAASDMIDMAPKDILALAYRHLHDEQAIFDREAALVAPGKPASAAVDLILHDHPTADDLIPLAGRQLADLRKFVKDHDILTIPSEVVPVMAATPEFQRTTVSAEFDPPGNFDKPGLKSYYYVTPPDKDLSPAALEDYLEAYPTPRLLLTSVHEVWPGHFMQYLTETVHPEWSETRRRAQAQSTVEGWAHYTEQMMVEQGLGKDDPKIAFGQTLEALLRDCRMVAAVEMHVNGMDVAGATKLFEDQCHSPEPEARREALRGTGDPGYLTYTTGKLAILKLREDYRQKLGDQFTLAKFHDAFLGAGNVPIRIIRRELLGTDSPIL